MREHVFHSHVHAPVFLQVFLDDLDEGLILLMLFKILADDLSNPSDVWNQWRVLFPI